MAARNHSASLISASTSTTAVEDSFPAQSTEKKNSRNFFWLVVKNLSNSTVLVNFLVTNSFYLVHENR